jgi:hypothetical protein
MVAVSGMPSRRGDASAPFPPALDVMGSRLMALALGAGELEASLREGLEAAWIVALPRQVATRCLARERLSWAAPWLPLPADDGAARITPLVETRWQVLLRAGRVGLVVAGDGTPRLVFAGREG